MCLQPHPHTIKTLTLCGQDFFYSLQDHGLNGTKEDQECHRILISKFHSTSYFNEKLCTRVCKLLFSYTIFPRSHTGGRTSMTKSYFF